MNPNASLPANRDIQLAADALCDRFERAWQDGSKPDLASWVPAPGALEGELRSAALPELVLLDMEYRFRAGDAVASEHYVNLYPELGGAAFAGRLHAAEDRLRRSGGRQGYPALRSSRYLPTRPGPAARRRPMPTPEWPRAPAQKRRTSICPGFSRHPGARRTWPARTIPRSRNARQGGHGHGSPGRGHPAPAAGGPEDHAAAARRRCRGLRAFPARGSRRRLSQARQHRHHLPGGAERGVPFIALEYLQGSPLDRYLKENGEASIAQAIRIGREIAEGLHAAHVRGLVHRDIKPGNIWLESRDEPGRMQEETVHSPSSFRVKILDFGLARPELDDTHLTQSGAIVGTPAFMSPEQASGEAVDARSDLWSLGVVLYRLCTGKQPFSGNNTLALLTSLALETPAAVRQLNPSVPVELEQLINRLLAKKRDERPISAREVVKVLSTISATVHTVPTPAKSALDIGGSSSVGSTNVLAPRQSPEKRSRGTTVAKWMTVAFLPFLVVLGSWYILQLSHKDGTVPVQKLPDGAKGETIDPKGGKVTIVPPSEPKVDYDRRAVEMLRPHVQTFFIRLRGNGREAWIKPADAIPEVPFVLKAIRFHPRSSKLPVDFTPRRFLPAVLPLDSLESIGFYDVRIFMNEDELAKFTEAPFAGKIKNLGLHFELNQKNIESLKRFPKLESLHCDAATTSDADVVRLKELPLLGKLWLGSLGKSGGVTPKSYETIASLPLKSLGLRPGSPTLDGDALALLATMPHLTEIFLDGSGITDKTLPDFSKLKQLQIIGLFGSNVTDDGLMKLAKAKSLRQVLTRAGKKPKLVTEAGPNGYPKRCQLAILLPGGVKIGPKDKSLPPLPPDDDPDDADDPDRKAVEMLRPYVTSFVIRLVDNVKELTLTPSDPIPDEHFVVKKIQFGGSPKLPKNGDVFDNLMPCNWMRKMYRSRLRFFRPATLTRQGAWWSSDFGARRLFSSCESKSPVFPHGKGVVAKKRAPRTRGAERGGKC